VILGVDAGNYKAKVAGVHGVDSFKTNVCNWFERNVEETFGNDDMEFQINGRKGFAGSIAEFEDEFGDGTTYGESKAHEDTQVRVLLAIHRYMEKYSLNEKNVYIVTGQPISRHTEIEKNQIINMLKGHHEFVVNGIHREIYIKDVKVSPEGSGAFWSNPLGGMVRILDIGSGTVNMVSISNKNFIHKSSGTMNTGMETLKNKNDLDGMARGIIQSTLKLKWKKDDSVFICGGASEKIVAHIKKHYVNAEIIKPLLKREHDVLSVQPIYANAVGFYNLAKWAYQ
jgi:plasmid segregation protein ParM